MHMLFIALIQTEIDMAVLTCKRKWNGVTVDQPSKRQRVDLCLEQKLELIAESKKFPKPSQKDLSLMFGIGRATVSDILKREEYYQGLYHANSAVKKKRFQSACKFKCINTAVYQWFCQIRTNNSPISGPLIQTKALQISQDLGITDFKASNGWLESWRNSHSIGNIKECCKSDYVEVEVVNDLNSNQPEIIDFYSKNGKELELEIKPTYDGKAENTNTTDTKQADRHEMESEGENMNTTSTKQADLHEMESEGDLGTCTDDDTCELTYIDMLEMLKKMRMFAIQKDGRCLPIIETLKRMIEKTIVKDGTADLH